MKQPTHRFNGRLAAPLFVFVTAFGLYVATLAPSVVPGDPGEYQFIPHILGIAHPPGYAFFTVLAKLWTSVVRIGSVAYRTNLLSAAAGAWTGVMVYGIVVMVNWETGRLANWGAQTQSTHSQLGNLPIYYFPALFAAAVLVTSTDLWQHSIHANSHVVSAALSATTLYSGLRWWVTRDDRWLYNFVFLAAIGVTHHPLLAIGAPAYVVFALSVRPRLLRDWRRLGKIVLTLMLGLSVFFYLPLRAGATPCCGPLPNADAIIGHMTARGIRGNLFHFGLGDQPVRLRVYWELLRLQFALPVLALAVIGLIWLARRRPRPFLLLILFYALNLAFTINTVQDVMAYLLLPFTTTALFAGFGVLAVLDGLLRVLRGRLRPRGRLWPGAVIAVVASLLAAGPVMGALHKAPRLSLRDYRLADEHIDAVFEQFDGKGKGAILLAHWEALTPLWYAEHVQGRKLDPTDVQLVYVAAGGGNPWVDNVWANIEDGPIYLSSYRPEVADAGLRLRPVGDGPLYKVETPPATDPPPIPRTLDLWAGDTIHLVDWDLDRTTLRAGETAYLTLYLGAPGYKLTDYYMPYLWLGDRLYRWTTDRRLNTPWWEPDEFVVERYAITVPFGTPPGDYPLRLGFSNVSQGQDLLLSNGETTVTLPDALQVEPAKIAPPEKALTSALANLNSRIVLTGGHASARGRTMETPWSEPLPVRPGDSIQVWLDWRALSAVDAPYNVFVHLIDAAGGLWAQHDYSPMGGAFPTFLWIPRWIEGQKFSDPYKLFVPAGTPPGDYWIEIGIYGSTNLRRAYHFDRDGNLAGDRYILGPVRIETP